MDTEPVDPAVQAFEALRTEIAVLSAEITLALAEQRAITAKPAPDYDLTLGRIAKQLAELTTRVAAVEGKPALAFTAQSFGTELGSIMRQEAGLARITLYQAMEAAREQADELRKVAVDRVLSRSAWWWRVAGGAAFGTVLGVMACFGAVAAFPKQAGGWIVTAIIGNGGPWQAGQTLLRTSDPASYERLVRLSNACGDQSTELCEAAIAVRTIPPLPNQAPPASIAPRGGPSAKQ